MVPFSRRLLLCLPLALPGAAGCELSVDPIRVHADRGAAHDAGERQPDDAGPTHDAAVEPPISPFRDDFERARGPLDGAWVDRGPGTPEIWNGELCLQPEEQVEHRVDGAGNAYVALRVSARIGFELRFAGEREDLLSLVWDDGGAIRTSQGIEISPGAARVQRPSTHDLHITLDFTTQSARIDVDGGRAESVPLLNLEPERALRALRVLNGFPDASPRVMFGCIDNVYVAAEAPPADPFPDPGPGPACKLEVAPVSACAARYCCDELHLTDPWTEKPIPAPECIGDCLAAYEAGTADYCACTTAPDPDPLALCVQTFCMRDSVEPKP
jgi:hypothetical protein